MVVQLLKITAMGTHQKKLLAVGTRGALEQNSGRRYTGSLSNPKITNSYSSAKPQAYVGLDKYTGICFCCCLFIFSYVFSFS